MVDGKANVPESRAGETYSSPESIAQLFHVRFLGRRVSSHDVSQIRAVGTHGFEIIVSSELSHKEIRAKENLSPQDTFIMTIKRTNTADAIEFLWDPNKSLKDFLVIPALGRLSEREQNDLLQKSIEIAIREVLKTP